MKIIIRKPIRMVLDRTRIEEDDGDLYYTVEPGEYDLDETEEHDIDEGRIDLRIPLTASFWMEDVEEDEYEVEGEDY